MQVYTLVMNKLLYQALYNNLLLPRNREIDRGDEREAFDGTTESLVNLYRVNQNSEEKKYWKDNEGKDFFEHSTFLLNGNSVIAGKTA